MHRYVRSLRSAACLALCVAASIAQNVKVVEIRPESTPQDAPRKVEVKVERQVVVNGAEAPVETRVIEIAPQGGRAKSTQGAPKAAPLVERVIKTILKPDGCNDADDCDDCDDAEDCEDAEECVRVDCTEAPCEGFATIELEDLGESAEFSIAEELADFEAASSDMVVALSELDAASSDDCCECTCGKCCMHGKKKHKNVAIEVERTQRSGPEWRSDEVPPTPARGAARNVVIRRAEAVRKSAEEAREGAAKARSAAGVARDKARAEMDRARATIRGGEGPRRYVERRMAGAEDAMKQAHEAHRQALEDAEKAMRDAQNKFPRALRATGGMKRATGANSTESSDAAESSKSVTLFGSAEHPMVYRSLRTSPAAEAPEAPVAPKAPKAPKTPKAAKAPRAPMPPMSADLSTGGGLDGATGGVFSTGPGGSFVFTEAIPGSGGDSAVKTQASDDAMHAEIEALRKELHDLRAQLHEMRAAGRGSDSPKKR